MLLPGFRSRGTIAGYDSDPKPYQANNQRGTVVGQIARLPLFLFGILGCADGPMGIANGFESRL
jgi:hypothetical protein